MSFSEPKVTNNTFSGVLNNEKLIEKQLKYLASAFSTGMTLYEASKDP
jgi:hypothetical protein